MKQAKILFTTDMHGFFMPGDYTDRSEKAQGLSCLCTGFHKDGNSLVIDGGDTLQGSPFTSGLRKLGASPALIAQAMNIAGYDAVSLGNHDFNYGIEHLAEYINALDAKALCANIEDKEGLLRLSPASLFTLENGLRIGLVGACTHHVSKWEPKETLDRLHIRAPLADIKKAYEDIKDSCDIRVLVYHGGFERDVETGVLYSQSDENQAYLFAQTLDFDLVLTGHQHFDIINSVIAGSHVVQVSNNAQHFAQIDITLLENGEKKISSHFVKAALPADEKMLAALSPMEEKVQDMLDERLSVLDTEIKTEKPIERALNGSLLANFISQVQKDASGCRISASSIPGNGIDLKKELSVREVLVAYPYANTLFVLAMSGKMLREYMEVAAGYFDVKDGKIGVAQRFLRPKASHYNYDYFSGIFYTIDLNREEGSRITSLTLDGKEIKDDQKIEICVNSYRAKGSGGYDVVKEAEVLREINFDIAQFIIDYLSKNPLCTVDKTKYYKVILPANNEQKK